MSTWTMIPSSHANALVVVAVELAGRDTNGACDISEAISRLLFAVVAIDMQVRGPNADREFLKAKVCEMLDSFTWSDPGSAIAETQGTA